MNPIPKNVPQTVPRVSLIRSLLFFTLFHFGGFFVILFIYINAKVRPRHSGRHGRMVGIHFLTHLLKLIGISHTVEDPDNLLSQHAIFAFNHQSNWEDFVPILFIKTFTSFLVKKEVTRIPLFGKCAPYYGGLLIDRKGSKENLKELLLQAHEDVHNQGHSLFICPEGTRVKPGTPYKSKSGAYLFYQKLGLPVVPIAHNSGLFWGKPFRMTKGIISVKVGPLIPPHLPKSEFLQKLDTTLNSNSQELLPPSLRHQ